jgi:hypothetical protein
MTALLGVNYKLEKSVPGYRLIGLSLAPHTMGGGSTVCPYSTVECRSVCLGTETGHNVMATALAAKVKRTKLWLEHPERFKAQLATEVMAARRSAVKAGLKLAVRLNVYSDILWEQQFPELFEAFHDVQFYDYTKVPIRLARPENYHLTYSYSGTPASLKTATSYLDAGVNVAMIYSSALPETSLFGYGKVRALPVINGDLNDFRPADPHPCIVGLSFKGPKANLVSIKKFVQQGAQL